MVYSIFFYDYIYNLFKNCKLSLTISSTAGLESLLAKIPTFFISDLSQPNAANSLIQKINAEGIEINHLINNARSLDSLQVKDLYDNNYKEINYRLVKDAIRFDGENTTRLTQEIVNLVDVK